MSEKKSATLDLTSGQPNVPRGELASVADADARQSSRKAGDGNTPGPTELSAVRRATGKNRETLTHRDKYDFVTVDYLKRDFEFDGVVYNGGANVEIPDQLAGALGLTGKRTTTRLTRREEIEEGLDKAEKHPTAVGDQKTRPFNAIPPSDPAHELPSLEEREAAMRNAGISAEQLAEKAKAEAAAAEKAAKK